MAMKNDAREYATLISLPSDVNFGVEGDVQADVGLL